MSSCLKPCWGIATSGADICRWYGRRQLLPSAAGVNKWGRLWLSDGVQGRHGSDICRWNLLRWQQQQQQKGKEGKISTTFQNYVKKKNQSEKLACALFGNDWHDPWLGQRAQQRMKCGRQLRELSGFGIPCLPLEAAVGLLEGAERLDWLHGDEWGASTRHLWSHKEMWVLRDEPMVWSQWWNSWRRHCGWHKKINK